MQEFNYYFEGVRHTSAEEQYLADLTAGYENAQEIIEGVLNSYAYWLTLQ